MYPRPKTGVLRSKMRHVARKQANTHLNCKQRIPSQDPGVWMPMIKEWSIIRRKLWVNYQGTALQSCIQKPLFNVVKVYAHLLMWRISIEAHLGCYQCACVCGGYRSCRQGGGNVPFGLLAQGSMHQGLASWRIACRLDESRGSSEGFHHSHCGIPKHGKKW